MNKKNKLLMIKKINLTFNKKKGLKIMKIC